MKQRTHSRRASWPDFVGREALPRFARAHVGVTTTLNDYTGPKMAVRLLADGGVMLGREEARCLFKFVRENALDPMLDAVRGLNEAETETLRCADAQLSMLEDVAAVLREYGSAVPV